MNKDEVEDRAIAWAQAGLANLPYAGSLGSKLPRPPVDYIRVVMDLNDASSQLKGGRKRENARQRCESYDMPSLKFPHATSQLESRALLDIWESQFSA